MNKFSDFQEMFDVDYGNCYTFNYAYPDVKYHTTRPGSDYGRIRCAYIFAYLMPRLRFSLMLRL